MLSLIAGAATFIPGVGPLISGGLSLVGTVLRCTPCLVALAIGAAFLYGDIHGHRASDATCAANDVKMQLAAAERDKAAADDAKQFAEQQSASLAAENAALKQKVDDYAKAPHAVCPLGDDRANRLRNIAPGQP